MEASAAEPLNANETEHKYDSSRVGIKLQVTDIKLFVYLMLLPSENLDSCFVFVYQKLFIDLLICNS